MKTDDYPVSRAYAWYVCALLLLLMIFGLMDRMIISVLLPHLKSEWSLSDSQLGVLVSAVNWSMAAFALPVAFLVDRWSRKKAIGLMAMVWSMATIACGLAGSFAQMLTARLFVGAGEGGYGPGGASMLSGLFPERLRATVLGFLNTAGSLGGVLGIAIGGYITVRWGWRVAFIAVAIPGLLLTLIFILTVRDTKAPPLEIRDRVSGLARKMKLGELVRSLVCTPSLIAVYAAGTFVVFFATSLLAWLPSFLVRVEGMSTESSAFSAALILLASSAGIATGGMASDWLRRRWKKMLLLAPAIASLAGGIIFGLSMMLLHGQELLAGLIAGAFFKSSGLGPLFAVSQSVVHAGMRATVVGVMNIVWQALGGMGPLFTGMLSDSFGIRAALAMTSLSLVAAAIAMLVGAMYHQKDVRALEESQG